MRRMVGANRWWRYWVIAAWLVATACGSIQNKLVGQPVKKPVALLVRVSPEAAESDDPGAVASLVETLASGLEERGMQVEVFAADDDSPPAPRIEVYVREVDTGSLAARSAGAMLTSGLVWGLGTGDIVVDCKVFHPGKKKPALEERFKQRIGGVSQSAAGDAGASLGEDILDEVMTD